MSPARRQLPAAAQPVRGAAQIFFTQMLRNFNGNIPRDQRQQQQRRGVSPQSHCCDATRLTVFNNPACQDSALTIHPPIYSAEIAIASSSFLKQNCLFNGTNSEYHYFGTINLDPRSVILVNDLWQILIIFGLNKKQAEKYFIASALLLLVQCLHALAGELVIELSTGLCKIAQCTQVKMPTNLFTNKKTQC